MNNIRRRLLTRLGSCCVELSMKGVKNEKQEEIRMENNLTFKYKEGKWIIC